MAAGVVPQKIDVSLSQGVTITWSDGHLSQYAIRALREACPCATCNDLHATGSEPATRVTSPPPGVLPMYRPAGATLTGVQAVGNYALQFHFSDRHNTGIYTWEYLRGLCRCAECQPG